MSRVISRTANWPSRTRRYSNLMSANQIVPRLPCFGRDLLDAGGHFQFIVERQRGVPFVALAAVQRLLARDVQVLEQIDSAALAAQEDGVGGRHMAGLAGGTERLAQLTRKRAVRAQAERCVYMVEHRELHAADYRERGARASREFYEYVKKDILHTRKIKTTLLGLPAVANPDAVRGRTRMSGRSRRFLVHGAVLLLAAVASRGAAAADSGAANAADGWTVATPEQVGMQAAVLDGLDAAVSAGKLNNLHAVVVVRDGKLVFERYYAGTDERWTVPLGHVQFGPDMKHDLRSTSKSLVGLLYGIALGEGKVAAPDQSLLAQFPAYQDLQADPVRRKVKVEHVLSMTLGTEWREDLPYTDPRNSEVAMYLAPNAARYVIEQRMAVEPGTRWQYSGGATAVLGQLIAQGTKVPLEDYARQKLFLPLGITDAEWIGGSHGVVAAASGARLRARDLAKIGQLVLDGGRWGERQVVPATWIENSLQPHAHPPPMSDIGEFGYGYHWGLVQLKGSGQRWVFAPGNGGQRLMIVPQERLVVAIFAGNYNQPAQDDVPNGVISQFVIPALAAADPSKK